MNQQNDAKKNQKIPVRRCFEGEVVSDKMTKTVVVKVVRTYKHPLLGKTVKKFKKYKVHDEDNVAKIGDIVEMTETRPLSKTKHMTLTKVLRKTDMQSEVRS